MLIQKTRYARYVLYFQDKLNQGAIWGSASLAKKLIAEKTIAPLVNTPFSSLISEMTSDRRYMRANESDLLRRAYEAFNRRDVDAVLAVMQPDVEWANGLEGGTVQGH
ncbi:MAG: nuclear transport factor 2 family protein, partial [Verrucomicrobia bacterium]|nr:nuclear transport factor 2 family protein [Verrucomicrobiota bacterium]